MLLWRKGHGSIAKKSMNLVATPPLDPSEKVGIPEAFA
jgi:hypothetical protein